jgi:hypothetical protein
MPIGSNAALLLKLQVTRAETWSLVPRPLISREPRLRIPTEVRGHCCGDVVYAGGTSSDWLQRSMLV